MLRSLTILATLLVLSYAHERFDIEFAWKYINYTWPSSEVYLAARKDGSYVEKNNVIVGMKFWKDKMFLAVPRWKSGVPVTLAVTSADAVDNDTAPLLEPYPNWEMQKIGNCSAFQSVLNMEVDPKGRMWLLDTGRVETATRHSKALCPPRLVILDLENGGNVLRTYTFPEEIADYHTSYLMNIVLEHEDGGFAYISDAGSRDPGLIVYSLANNTSWKVRHNDSMIGTDNGTYFMVEDIIWQKTIHIAGIALSPASKENRDLYYSPISSLQMFSVKTRVLKDPNVAKNISEHVKVLGDKPYQSSNMVMSNEGQLYFGLLGDDAVSVFESGKTPFFENGQLIVFRDHDTAQFPDSFAFDSNGRVRVVCNRLHRVFFGELDLEQTNFRVFKSEVGLKNYQYYQDGTAPELPTIVES